MSKLLTKEQRRSLYQDLMPQVAENTQAYVRLVCRMLRTGYHTAQTLQSHLTQVGNTELLGDTVHYIIWKENTCWGQPCHYEMFLEPDGRLSVTLPVGERALTRAFKTDNYGRLEETVDKAIKMVAPTLSDLACITYCSDARAFTYWFK